MRRDGVMIEGEGRGEGMIRHVVHFQLVHIRLQHSYKQSQQNQT